MGTVMAVESSGLTIRTKDGARTSLVVDDKTTYYRGSAPATFSDVKVGDRVVVSAVEQGDRKVAREIRMAPSEK